MSEISRPRTIHVSVSMRLAKHGFELIGEEDYGEYGASQCGECGHPVRYGEIFKDLKTGEMYSIGRECAHKPYLFKIFKNITQARIDDPNSIITKIGALFWKIDKEKLWDTIEGLIKRKEIGFDLYKLPKLNEEKEYMKQLKGLYKHALNLRETVQDIDIREQQRAAEEQRRKKLLEMATQIALKDEIFMQLYKIKFEEGTELEGKRKYLLRLYINRVVEWGADVETGWYQDDYNNVYRLIERHGKEKEISTKRKETGMTKEQVDMLVVAFYNALLVISSVGSTPFEKDFTKNFANSDYFRVKGSTGKQRGPLVSITSRYFNSQQFGKKLNDVYPHDKVPTIKLIEYVELFYPQRP